MTTRRRQQPNLTGLKYLIASLSLGVSVGLWSMFSTRDQLAQSFNDQDEVVAQEAAPGQLNGLVVDPFSQLLTLDTSGLDGDWATKVQQAPAQLRSVSAPQLRTQPSSNPIVVGGNMRPQSNSGSGSQRAGTVTTTTKSSG